MRLMQPRKVHHVRMISHEGKLVVVGIRSDGVLVYTIRRDGFEDSADTDRILDTWENWQIVPLPKNAAFIDDESVHAYERHNNTLQNADGSVAMDDTGEARYLTRSRYGSDKLHDVAPISLVSGMGLIHIFRQSRTSPQDTFKAGPVSLLVDRFVLDGLQNRLVAKLDLRFRRSRQRHEPLSAGAGSKLVVDSLDFRDANDTLFTEPSTELDFINADNGFSVALAPAGEPDRFNWHFLTAENDSDDSSLTLTLVRADDSGGFDLTDRETQLAIERRMFRLLGNKIYGVPALTRFDKQAERLTASGERQWLRVSTSLMIAVPVSSSTAVVGGESDDDRAVATVQLPLRSDGFPAAVEQQNVSSKRLRGTETTVAMPPDTLLRARAVATTEVRGSVAAFARTDDGAIEIVAHGDAETDDTDADDEFSASELVDLDLDETPSLDGLYSAKRIQLGTITRDLRVGRKATYLAVRLSESLPKGTRLQLGNAGIVTTRRDLRIGLRMIDLETTEVAAPKGSPVYLADVFSIPAPAAGLGNWHEVSADAGARVDGQVLGATVDANNRVRINAPGHGLDDGDQVEISGTRSLDGVHRAVRSGGSFILDRSWPFGEALDIERRQTARRGLVFADEHARIRVEHGALVSTSEDFTIECWVRCSADAALVGWYPQPAPGDSEDSIEPGSGFWFGITHGLPALHRAEASPILGSTRAANLTDGQWHHVAAVFARPPLDTSSKPAFPGAPANSGTADNAIADTDVNNGWSVAFVVDGVASSMLPLEQPMASSSRTRLLLGASDPFGDHPLGVAGGELSDVRLWQRALTPAELDNYRVQAVYHDARGLVAFWRLGAVLHGDEPTVIDATISRNDGVVQGKVWATPVTIGRHMADGQTPVSKLENATLVGVAQGVAYREEIEYRFIGGDGSLALDVWGMNSRANGIRIPIDSEADAEVGTTRTNDDWQRASVRFRVPDGVTVLRSVAASVDGEWTRLELRNHRLLDTHAITSERIVASDLALDSPKASLGETHANSAGLAWDVDSKAAQSKALKRRLAQLNDRLGLAEQTESVMARLRADVKNLAEQITRLESRRRALDEDPLNYWISIAVFDLLVPGGIGYLRAMHNDWDGRLIIDSSSRGNRTFDAQNWWRMERFNGASGESIRLYTHNAGIGSRQLIVHHGRARIQGALTQINNSFKEWRLPTRFEADRRTRSSTISSIDHGDVYVRVKSVAMQTQIAELYPSSGGRANPATMVILEKSTVMHDSAKREFDQVEFELVTKGAEKSRKERQLNSSISSGEADRLRQIIADTEDHVGSLENQLADIELRFGEARKQGKALGAGLSLAPANDPGLPATAALLKHVQTTSDISLFPSATGDVLLNYHDSAGRIRQSRYDACSGGKNATADQWVADGLRQALIDDSAVRLPTPLSGNNWTIEAWVRFPLKGEHRLLASASGADEEKSAHGIGAYYGQFSIWTTDPQLGGAERRIKLDRSLSEFHPGWHHLAIVAGADSPARTLRFYVDGLQHGSTVQAMTEQSEANDGVVGGFLPSEPLDTLDVGNGLSDLRIWQQALDAEEINANSKLRISGHEPGLLAWYPLDGSLENPVRPDALTVDRAKFGPCTAPVGNVGQRVAVFDGQRRDEFLLGKDSRSMTLEMWLRFEADIELRDDVDELSNDRSRRSPSQIILHLPLEDPNEGFGHFLLWLSEPMADGSQVLRADFFSDSQRRSSELLMVADAAWHHITISTAWNGAIALWLDAKPGSTDTGFVASDEGRDIPRTGPLVGGLSTDEFDLPGFRGELAELRVRNGTWTPQQLSRYRHSRAGDEVTTHLPFDQPSVEGKPARIVNDLPIAGSDIQLAEYPTYSLDSDGRRVAILRRATAIAADKGVEFLAQQRVEKLDLAWIGNAQFQPTLLGYIEGAPPVPSENLTVKAERYYQDATSITLSMSEEVELSWNRSKETTHGFGMDFFIGYENKWEVGANAPLLGRLLSWNAGGLRAGLAANFAVGTTDSNESTIAFSTAITRSDTVGLRGSTEDDPAFPDIGSRFVPKNVGYALVVAGLADVFVSRLATTGRMVGYQTIPVSDVPPDVTTITFLINPAYTMNGSLDGLTGMQATSDRFHAHVPEARRQFGSSYPASYFRLQEAYTLRAFIRDEDKRRESFFANFSVDVSLSDDTIAERIDDPEFAPKSISIEREEDKPVAAPASTPGGEEDKTDLDDLGALGADKADDADQQADDIRDKIGEEQEEKKELVNAKKEEIKRLQRPEQREHAASSFRAWQTKMETLQIRAGKRNLVNSYVWDADGGLRTESEEFAATIEHTVGSAIDMEWGLGADIALNVSGFQLELSPMYQGSMSQTLSKTRSSTSALALEVDLSGVESLGVTDFKDRPLLAGSKVDRYRFMTFYLDGAEKNFDDFFRYVVDPEWLASSDEEARALRQTRSGAKSKPWRVMHRVTQVERPALSGFGDDTRPLPRIEEPSELEQQLAAIEAQVARLADDQAQFASGLQTRISEVRALLTDDENDSARGVEHARRGADPSDKQATDRLSGNGQRRVTDVDNSPSDVVLDEESTQLT